MVNASISAWVAGSWGEVSTYNQFFYAVPSGKLRLIAPAWEKPWKDPLWSPVARESPPWPRARAYVSDNSPEVSQPRRALPILWRHGYVVELAPLFKIKAGGGALVPTPSREGFSGYWLPASRAGEPW